MESTSKARRTTKVGTVVSDAMDKTVVVKVESVVKHKLYHRFVQRSRKFVAHDEGNALQGGRQGPDRGVPPAFARASGSAWCA